MNVNEAADLILASKKYCRINRAVVERICAEKLHGAEKINSNKKQNDFLKAVKNELHIIHESFLPQNVHEKAAALLDNYNGDIKTDREFAARLLELHASTRERLPEAAAIYAFIGKYTGSKRIIDLGCGFNPFALPYYTSPPAQYTGLDINESTIQLLEKYFKMTGLDYQTGLFDAAAQIWCQSPFREAEVLLMLKLAPLLEHQKKGRPLELVKILGCPISIISFPIKSASGKEKGMEAFYSTQFEKTLAPDFSIIEKKIFKNEMFYIIKEKLESKK
ncbi:MAG: hypothetical protein FWD78_14295 [Treponema sp.]|nr:hypothetical protein [Treponema sp.]